VGLRAVGAALEGAVPRLRAGATRRRDDVAAMGARLDEALDLVDDGRGWRRDGWRDSGALRLACDDHDEASRRWRCGLGLVGQKAPVRGPEVGVVRVRQVAAALVPEVARRGCHVATTAREALLSPRAGFAGLIGPGHQVTP